MQPLEALEKVRAKYRRDVPPPKPAAKTRKVEYAEYLATPAWRDRAGRVMLRARNRCEGCGVRKASEVHHLTYAHIFHEFLFELVALCSICHDRWHAIPHPDTRPTKSAAEIIAAHSKP